jgi:hypothetical protein
MDVRKFFERECWPVKLSLIVIALGLISILILPSQVSVSGHVTVVNKMKMAAWLILKGFIWIALIYYLCRKNQNALAWVVFVVPLVFSYGSSNTLELYGTPSGLAACKAQALNNCPTGPVVEADNCRQKSYIDCIHG